MERQGGAATGLPVFVDSSGRRGRALRRACWALGLVMGAYVAVVLLALVGPPGLSRLAVPGLGPVLPGAAAPDLRTGGGRKGTPDVLLTPGRAASSSATPAQESPRTAATGSPVGGGNRSAGTVPAGPVPSSRPTSAPTHGPTPTAAPTPRRTGPPTTPKPRASRVPPGQSSAHPTPHSTNAHGGKPSPTP